MSRNKKDGTSFLSSGVARSLVSMIRSSGIRKDYIIDDAHGQYVCCPALRVRQLCGWVSLPFYSCGASCGQR